MKVALVPWRIDIIKYNDPYVTPYTKVDRGQN